MKKEYKPVAEKAAQADAEAVKSPWRSAIKQMGWAKTLRIVFGSLLAALLIALIVGNGFDFVESRYGFGGVMVLIVAGGVLKNLFPPRGIVLEDRKVVVDGRAIGRASVRFAKPLTEKSGVELTLIARGEKVPVVTDGYAEADQREIRDALLSWAPPA